MFQLWALVILAFLKCVCYVYLVNLVFSDLLLRNNAFERSKQKLSCFCLVDEGFFVDSTNFYFHVPLEL